MIHSRGSFLLSMSEHAHSYAFCPLFHGNPSSCLTPTPPKLDGRSVISQGPWNLGQGRQMRQCQSDVSILKPYKSTDGLLVAQLDVQNISGRLTSGWQPAAPPKAAVHCPLSTVPPVALSTPLRELKTFPFRVGHPSVCFGLLCSARLVKKQMSPCSESILTYEESRDSSFAAAMLYLRQSPSSCPCPSVECVVPISRLAPQLHP